MGRLRWLAVAALLGAVACGDSDTKVTEPVTVAGPLLWVLPSADAIDVPAPPDPDSDDGRAEVTEIRTLVLTRTPEVQAMVSRWTGSPATRPWVERQMSIVAEHGKNPPLAARGYALAAVAANDAVVAAEHWQRIHDRPLPAGTDPMLDDADGYPSAHAALAGAVSRVLFHLYPERSADEYDAWAEEAAESRIAAGVNLRSDVEAGLALGRAVAERVIARSRSDGGADHWAIPWSGTVPVGDGLWVPDATAPPEKRGPVEPRAGEWKTWVVAPASVRPPPPPAFGTDDYRRQAQAVVDASAALTDAQRASATRWAGGAGTPLPPGLWNEIALAESAAAGDDLARAAAVLAALNVAQADAGILVWACKYEYWTARPVTAIAALGLAPGWKSFIPTPAFPSYVSGHSAFSAASAAVLGAAYPERKEPLLAMAQEAARSRLYGGIHFPIDNEEGLRLGERVGAQVVAKAFP